jgi:hypothetical protein
MVLGCDGTETPINSYLAGTANAGSLNSNLDVDDTVLAFNTEASRDDETKIQSIRVLFIGNSHSAPIPALMKDLVKRLRPDQKAHFGVVRSSGFLAEQAESATTRTTIRTGKWDYVVLQAQKYSSSGKRSYPTDGAMKLSELATKAGAKLLMYPEWPRRDAGGDEYGRIKTIHLSIAEKTGAMVAPIGEAWVKAAASNPSLSLYARDGNHATQDGSYLNACVFYSLLFGESPVSETSKSPKGLFKSHKALEEAAWSAVEECKSEKDGPVELIKRQK